MTDTILVHVVDGISYQQSPYASEYGSPYQLQSQERRWVSPKLGDTRVIDGYLLYVRDVFCISIIPPRMYRIQWALPQEPTREKMKLRSQQFKQRLIHGREDGYYDINSEDPRSDEPARDSSMGGTVL
jgi:hypothetical protein